MPPSSMPNLYSVIRLGIRTVSSNQTSDHCPSQTMSHANNSLHKHRMQNLLTSASSVVELVDGSHTGIYNKTPSYPVDNNSSNLAIDIGSSSSIVPFIKV